MIARSKLTSQGQISGKRVDRCSSADIHHAVFETLPEPKTVEDMDEGIRVYFKQTAAPQAVQATDSGTSKLMKQ